MASVEVNLEEPAANQFKDLMARTSITRHPNADITLGAPTPVAGEAVTETSILVTTQNPYTRNSRLVRYRRANLTQAFGFLDMSVQMDSAEWSIEELITKVNALDHTQLLASELEFDPDPVPMEVAFPVDVLGGLTFGSADELRDGIPAPPVGTTLNVRLRAKVDSVLYVGRFWMTVTQVAET